MFGICGKGIIVFNLSNGISKCVGDVLYVLKLTKQLLWISQSIGQIFKMKFEATKCWLKSFDFNKMIIKVSEERRLYKLIGIVESLVAKCSIKIKRVTCGIKHLDNFYVCFKNHGQK
jgi:hypothetical protein